MNEPVRIIVSDVLAGLAQLADQSVHCCVTSPPYWGLRDYGVEGQIGLEPTPEAFVARMVEVFAAVRRVLRDDATLWLNLGDSYASAPAGNKTFNHGAIFDGRDMSGHQSGRTRSTITGGMKPKDLCMMPWRVALALQADGWYLRSVIVWHKRSPMPESVTDRPTSSWEPIFLLAKSERYFYDAEAVAEPSAQPERVGTVETTFSTSDPGSSLRTDTGRSVVRGATRNQRNVWSLGPEPYPEAHFATFPSEIPRRAIKAGTSERGCCPECGAGWVRRVEKTTVNTRPGNTAKYRDDEAGYQGHETKAGLLYRPETSVKTLGWEPGCTCPAAEPVPAVVLDPFLGSGTTIAVARELGRRGIGIELNPAYAELARIRIGKTERPSTFQDPRIKDSPLFTGGAL